MDMFQVIVATVMMAPALRLWLKSIKEAQAIA